MPLRLYRHLYLGLGLDIGRCCCCGWRGLATGAGARIRMADRRVRIVADGRHRRERSERVGEGALDLRDTKAVTADVVVLVERVFDV